MLKNKVDRAAYLREWRAKRKISRVCQRCNASLKSIDIHVTCAVCRTYLRNNYAPQSDKRQARYRHRVANKLCTDCGKPVDRPRLSCSSCAGTKSPKTRKRHHQIKLDVLAHYGSKCVCCAEANSTFLQIDHINDDGNVHRKNDTTARAIWTWLKRHNFPPGFQVLCANCNYAKRFGRCPHQEAA